jgi:methylenetetrahydrofolate--tRNA-(uracil-5-)-methyltransferase
MQNPQITIIGAGLAGSECAWQLAKLGVPVTLVEMRSKKKTLAHHSDQAAELVCSNSFRSNDISNAVGLIKEEMACLDSLIVRAAYHARVPAGGALAVDRDKFSSFVTEALMDLPNLTYVHDVITQIEKEGDGFSLACESGEKLSASRVVIATGPLTDDALAKWILEQTNEEYLYFYDSIAPIIEKDSIDFKKSFYASRYDKGNANDYVNCAMNEDQYEAFMDAIESAELAEVHEFDKAQFFEGCLPLEEMVRRGRETARFGPMKPVGLRDPADPETRHHAVVQLRQDNLHATLYNLVGFQTRMKWGDQKRIFRTIPGLENAEFVRFGSMHRNTYLCSPKLLKQGLELKSMPGIHFAGQITGCEGYVESAAMGLYVGRSLAKLVSGNELPPLPVTTAMGALVNHILKADPSDYQPMNINWGLITPIEERMKKMDKKLALVKRAVADFREWTYKS